MHPLIHQHLEDVRALCRRFEVRRLDLIGSAGNGAFDPARSDIDFVVEFEPQGWHDASKRYFGLLFALQELFGRPVDLVEAPAIRNPFFRADVERTRALLYAA